MAYKVNLFQKRGREVKRISFPVRRKYEAERKAEEFRGFIKGVQEQYPASKVNRLRVTIQKQ
jgi:hypothetical protein